jgi:ATPase family associated with various cellular activities (AAA)
MTTAMATTTATVTTTDARNPFDDLARTPAAHFKLYFFASVARVLDCAAAMFGSEEASEDQFPFLAAYREEMEARVPAGLGPEQSRLWWRGAIEDWELTPRSGAVDESAADESRADESRADENPDDENPADEGAADSRAAGGRVTGAGPSSVAGSIGSTGSTSSTGSTGSFGSQSPGAPHLPLRALAGAAGLSHDELTMLVCAGLVEEDARFGALFEAAQETPGQRRPTSGLLASWWRGPADAGEARASLRRLGELGLFECPNADAPRSEWVLRVPAALWEALRGDVSESPAPWARYRAAAELEDLGALILPPQLKSRVEQAPALLRSGEARALVVRGPRRNGRRTLVGAIARSLGLGLLEVEAFGAGGAVVLPGQSRADESRWRVAGPLAACLNALPVVRIELAPGEAAELPRLECCPAPLAVLLGGQGGVGGEAVERALTLTVPMPDRAERREHWRRSLGSPTRDLEEITEGFRLTGGNVRRAARLARVYASLAGREEIRTEDVREAARALGREALETLAARVETEGDWTQLAVSNHTFAELRSLESRCRQRERLAEEAGAGFGARPNGGVRALFSGPSGTGKTLAARLLAASLRKDLYRLDLSSVVNKYIGETEKNLGRVLSRAEELDVVLLLDEGDALLAPRTEVSNANDRYANLETNYLLQRLESYEGILVVTTNAGDRIDAAFQRRMDVCVQFSPPDAAERRSIWQLHLPAEHAVGQPLLDEVAHRCDLTGGQIRNAVLHASTVALEEGGSVTASHLEEAVRREYRKSGAVCPLRRGGRAHSSAASRW